MGEVQGGVVGAALEAKDFARLQQFIVAEAPILPAEDQGHRGVDSARGIGSARADSNAGGRFGLDQPAQGRPRPLQGQFLPFEPATGGHHPAAVGDRCGQVGVGGRLLELGLAMDRHAPGFLPQGIAAGGHQAQLGDGEIGAEAGNAAHIQGPGGLHQHHHDRRVRTHASPPWRGRLGSRLAPPGQAPRRAGVPLAGSLGRSLGGRAHESVCR